MRTPARQNIHGFTLIELMVAVAVLAVIVMLAAPSFQGLLQSQRMRSAAYDLVADLTLARSEALKRGQIANPITLTAATGGWSAGWKLTSGTEVISTRGTVGTGVTVTASDGSGTAVTSVTFDLNGRVSSSSATVKFNLVDSSGQRHRCVSLSPTGYPKSLTKECS